MTDARDHVPELDWLKGFAIVCVVCIHAEVYAHSLFFDRIVNRAVPIFIVLFGVTSELWWKRASRTSVVSQSAIWRWYRSRIERLVIPFWAMVLVWWLIVVASGSAARLHVGFPHALASLVAYAPWIGTSWFVTVILQLVMLYPVLRWLMNRLGPIASLFLFGGLCAFTMWNFLFFVQTGLELLGTDFVGPGWYYFWIFSPRLFWHVAAGVALARICGGRVGPILTASAVALAVFGSLLQEVVRGPPGDFFSPIREQLVAYLFDVPLAIGLLGLFRWVPLPQLARRILAWCGRSSWGIYLGHLLVHELIHIAGYTPEREPQVARALYAALLLGSGAALAVAGDWVRRRVQAISARSAEPVAPPPEGARDLRP
jgi:peptidoglycan/LPS O-acetylase OafA/YrhL